jgi:hypothetical protein
VQWDEVTAICAGMSLIGVIGMFVVRAVIQQSFEDQWAKIEARFASKEELETLRVRMESFVPRRSHGD